MRPFDHHIYSLLLDHDCVIIPSLGGFIASREQAHVDTIRQTAIPPRRKLAFNVYLKQNDGLLAKRLVETEHVTYPEALQEIEAYVSNCMDELGKGRNVNIQKVGRLSFDTSRNLQFEPDQQSVLLPDAFGLGAIPVHTLNAVPAARPEKKKQLRPSLPPSKKSGQQKERSLVGAIAIAGAILWFSFNVYLVSRDRYSKASLNPLDSMIPETEQVPAITPPPTTVRVETVYVAATAPVKEDAVVVKEDSTAVARTVKEQPAVPSTGFFFLVAGVFKSHENAERLSNELRAAGFAEAAIIDTNNNRFYVSYGRYATRDAAKAMAGTLRAQSRESWIYQR
jgi:cell division protein FtsN